MKETFLTIKKLEFSLVPSMLIAIVSTTLFVHLLHLQSCVTHQSMRSEYVIFATEHMLKSGVDLTFMLADTPTSSLFSTMEHGRASIVIDLFINASTLIITQIHATILAMD